MKKNERMKTLKNNGIDTSKYFTLVVNENLPAGTKINIAVDKTNDNPVSKNIIEDGYVRNTKLHRRFVAAQYFKMLESDWGWHGYLNKFYSYMYQFDMMFEEVRVLGKLEKRDKETFNERNAFFTRATVLQILDDYVWDVKNYVNGLKIKHCKGKPYVSIPGFGMVFTDELDKRVFGPIEAVNNICKKSYTYWKMYENLMTFKKVMIKLPFETRKSKVWVDAFQKEGAFYTLKNLIMFHDVKLYFNGEYYDKYQSMEILRTLPSKYEGYQMNALLKKTIDMNNFDFIKNMVEHI